MANDIGGVWRTIGGKRVFIKDGQDLASAMKESGKFKPKYNKKMFANDENYMKESEEKEEDRRIQKAIEDKETNEKISNTNKELKKEGKKEFDNRNKNKENYIKEFNEKYNNKEFYNKETNEVVNAETLANDYIQYGGSETFEEYSARRTKGLNQYKGEEKELDKVKQKTKYQQMKIEGEKENDYEYKLYKRAMTNPESIDPMTEWSTDWEDLDKRFKDRYEKENQKSDLMTAEQLKGKDSKTPLTEEEAERIARGKFNQKYGERFGNKTNDMFDYISTGETKKGLSNTNSIVNAIKQNKMDYEDDGLGGTYSLGEWGKKGYYVQFQDRESHQHDDIMKYPNASARVKSNTWARVWKDGELVQNIEDTKFGARQKVIDYFQKEGNSNYMNKGIRDAYEKYKNKHPNSKMTFTQFKDNNK